MTSKVHNLKPKGSPRVTIPRKAWNEAKLGEVDTFICSMNATATEVIYHPTKQVGILSLGTYTAYSGGGTQSPSIAIPPVFARLIAQGEPEAIVTVDLAEQSITVGLVE
jgi:hypothetical protein